MNTISVSKGLDPDQDRHCVGPDLGPNCLQRLSVNDKRVEIEDAVHFLITGGWR